MSVLLQLMEEHVAGSVLGAGAIMLGEQELLRRTGKASISDFLRKKTVYDMLRPSGKVLCFDTSIPIQLAFYALLEHDMAAGPLWDSSARRFVGLMSVYDFIDILRHYHRQGIPMDELSARTIGDIMADAHGRRLQHSAFQETAVDTDLFTVVTRLQQLNHRHLPVVPPSEQRVLAVVCYHDVLRYLVDKFREQRRLFDDAAMDLGIGTYGPACLTVPLSARLVDVLDLLERSDFSAVPIIDPESGKLVDLYNRGDITFLATATDAESVIANLEMTMQQVLELRGEVDVKDRLHVCTARASLQSIFELFAEVGFHRVVAVDEGRCVGIITARDLIAWAVTS